jgi:hypothetical protein
MAEFLRRADPEMAGDLNVRLTSYQSANPRSSELPPPATPREDASFGTMEREQQSAPRQTGLLVALMAAVLLLTVLLVVVVIGVGLKTPTLDVVEVDEPVKKPEVTLEDFAAVDTAVLPSWIEDAEPTAPRTRPPAPKGMKKKVPPKPAAKATTGYLMVNSVPPGGRVYVDGEEQGFTPLRIKVAAGEHDVLVIDEEGGNSKRATVTVAPGGMEQVQTAWIQ